MILRRLLSYAAAFLVILLVLSILTIYQYRDFLSSYFASSFSTAVGIGLYFLIFGVGIFLVIKAVLR